MSKQKGFVKMLVLIIIVFIAAIYLFSISKFNKEFNCVVMGNAYDGAYPVAPLSCQSFISYLLFGNDYGSDGIMF
ncbi:MAG: hypothetical protein HW401_400 [Parcubacteria group bacterium]|nr:hypothetical protein [Parcubacteria group bacterium]